MTVREKTLLKILIILAFACVFFFTIQNSRMNIKESQASINKYNEMLTALENKASLPAEKASDKSSKIYVPQMASSEIADTIIKELKQCGIVPLRYQILNDSKGEIIEVSIKCTNVQLVRYFKRIHGSEQPFTLTNISLKTEAEKVNVTMRFSVIPSRILIFDENNNYAVEKLFRPVYVYKEKKAEPKVVVEEKKKDDIINGNAEYSLIGKIKESDGIYYLYLKSRNTNRVLKISPEDIISENGNKYVIKADNKKILIEKGE